MMIDDVMYGMIPSANTAAPVSAPPEKRSRNPIAPVAVPFFSSRIELKSTYGTGTYDPIAKDRDDEDREEDLVPKVSDPEHVVQAREPRHGADDLLSTRRGECS